MNNVLIVSNNDKTTSVITQFIKDDRLAEIINAKSVSEARRAVLRTDFDLILINSPLPDEFGTDFSLTAAEKTSAGIVLLVKAENADLIAEKVEDFGVLVVSKPIVKQLFYQVLKLAITSRKRILGLQNENVRLQDKIEEMRLVDRAKCVLIQNLGMTEPEAHRHIEREAMNNRITRREVADGILKQYPPC